VPTSTRRGNTTTGAPRRKPRDLTRDKVINAALALIDKTGADAVSMRGVAAALGVTPMALYNHFSSKRDLLSAVAESVIAGADFDGGRAHWRDRVCHCFEVLRRLCLRHPGMPRLLEFEGTAPVSVFAPMEISLRALREAGLDDVSSVRAYFLLVGFTLAQAAYQTRPIPHLEPSVKIRTKRIAGRNYTAIERLELPSAWDFDASFAFGISLVLSGIEATVASLPRGAVPKRGHPRRRRQ
jgi:TetR/AcrR family transcriptional regulator, tetracycline repressor protein